MPDCINWIDEAPMLLTKKRQLDSLLGDCTRREKPDIDFKRHDLIGFEFMADCKAYFTFELRLDSLNQEYHFVTEERYGGCAGMSRFKHWYLIPKLEKGYQHKYLAMIGKAW